MRESATASGVGTGVPDRVPGFPGTLGMDPKARWASSSVLFVSFVGSPQLPLPWTGVAERNQTESHHEEREGTRRMESDQAAHRPKEKGACETPRRKSPLIGKKGSSYP